MTSYAELEVRAVIKLGNDIRNLVDAEYNVIKDFNEEEFWDYISALFPEAPRALVDGIYEEIY